MFGMWLQNKNKQFTSQVLLYIGSHLTTLVSSYTRSGFARLFSSSTFLADKKKKSFHVLSVISFDIWIGRYILEVVKVGFCCLIYLHLHFVFILVVSVSIKHFRYPKLLIHLNHQMSYTTFPMYRNGSIWSGGLYSTTNELLQMFIHHISYVPILQWELQNWICVQWTPKTILFNFKETLYPHSEGETAGNKKGFWCFAVCE